MPGKSVAAAGEARDARPRRGGRPDPPSASAAIDETLDRLRDALLRRIDEIEVQAAEQADQLALTPTEREQALRERVVVLEAAQARAQAELKRKEQEWQETLQKVEEDRKLITEAWERLERERVAGPPAQAGVGVRVVAGVAAGTGTVTPAAQERPAPAAFYAPPAAGEELVSREILRQFQALRGDVRRNAGNAGN
jgi:hypothetical protein